MNPPLSALEPVAPTGSAAESFLLFSLDETVYAVEARAVQEIISLPALTRIEEAPGYIAGCARGPLRLGDGLERDGPARAVGVPSSPAPAARLPRTARRRQGDARPAAPQAGAHDALRAADRLERHPAREPFPNGPHRPRRRVRTRLPSRRRRRSVARTRPLLGARRDRAGPPAGARRSRRALGRGLRAALRRPRPHPPPRRDDRGLVPDPADRARRGLALPPAGRRTAGALAVAVGALARHPIDATALTRHDQGDQIERSWSIRSRSLGRVAYPASS